MHDSSDTWIEHNNKRINPKSYHSMIKEIPDMTALLKKLKDL